MKETISMSMKETERIAIMDNLIAKRIKQKYASYQLSISGTAELDLGHHPVTARNPVSLGMHPMRCLKG